MKILTLNIRYGGGKRAERISDYCVKSGADVVVLTEFGDHQHEPSGRIMAGLGNSGYDYQIFTHSTQWQSDAVFVASKIPFDSQQLERGWARSFLPEQNLVILGGYLPWAPENQNDNRKKRKDAYWDSLLKFAEKNSGNEALVIGDFNSNLKKDHEKGFGYSEKDLLRLLDELQWVDLWDQYGRAANEKDRFTYIDMDGRWVRNDLCLASPALVKKWEVTTVVHDHWTRMKSTDPPLTDHSALIVELSQRRS